MKGYTYMETWRLLSLIPAVLLAATHFSLQCFTNRRRVPINKTENKKTLHWISIFSGISVSYVFLLLLPDIIKQKNIIEYGTYSSSFFFSEKLFVVIILFGFTLFSCLESVVKHHRTRKTVNILDDPVVPDVEELLPCDKNWIFLLHLTSYFFYTFGISYLLLKKLELFGQLDMWFFWFAMEAHYIIDDISLHDNFGKKYDTFGRWFLMVSTLLGWLVSYFTSLSKIIVFLVSSFIAGGTIINVIKEELPSETRGAIPLFLVSIVIFSVIIIAFI